jgi:hypothetical protein
MFSRSGYGTLLRIRSSGKPCRCLVARYRDALEKALDLAIGKQKLNCETGIAPEYLVCIALSEGRNRQ